MYQILVENVVAELKMRFHKFLLHFLCGDLIYDCVRVKPFNLGVDFLKGSNPVGGVINLVLGIV